MSLANGVISEPHELSRRVTTSLRVAGIGCDLARLARDSQHADQVEELAYTTGRVVRSGESLALPIIDTRNYTDDIADIHTWIRTFSFLDRLQKTNATTALRRRCRLPVAIATP